MKNIFLSFFIILFFIATLSLIDPSGFFLISQSITALVITLAFNFLLFFFILQSLRKQSYLELQNLSISLIFLLIIASIYSTTQAFSSPTFSLIVLFVLPLEILGIGYYVSLYYGINKINEKKSFNLKYFFLILFIIALPIYLLNLFLSMPV